MINIKVNNNGKGTEVICEVHVEGRKKAIEEFFGVIKALSDCDDEVLCDALEILISDKLGGNDDDESDS